MTFGSKQLVMVMIYMKGLDSGMLKLLRWRCINMVGRALLIYGE